MSIPDRVDDVVADERRHEHLVVVVAVDEVIDAKAVVVDLRDGAVVDEEPAVG